MAKKDAKLLINIATELKKIAENEIYVDVDTYQVNNLENSRYPVNLDEVCVEDYSFSIHIDGRSFLTKVHVTDKFNLHVEEYDTRSVYKKIENGYSKIFPFIKSDTKTAISQKLKDMIQDIHSTTDQNLPSRYYFNMWVKRQNFGCTNSTGNRAMDVQDIFYNMLTQYMAHEEFEKKVAMRYKQDSSRIDWSWKTELSRQTKVEVHSVLDRIFFAVVSKDEIFLYQTEEEAMDAYEEQSFRRLSEIMTKEIKEYERLKK